VPTPAVKLPANTAALAKMVEEMVKLEYAAFPVVEKIALAPFTYNPPVKLMSPPTSMVNCGFAFEMPTNPFDEAVNAPMEPLQALIVPADATLEKVAAPLIASATGWPD